MPVVLWLLCLAMHLDTRRRQVRRERIVNDRDALAEAVVGSLDTWKDGHQ